MEVRAKVEHVKVESKYNIVIPQWDPAHFFSKCLKEHGSFTSIISGCRMAGKSNLLKFFLLSSRGGKLMNKFDMIIVFSKTIMNGHYQQFLRSRMMFDSYKPEVLEAMQKMHEEWKQRGKKFRFLVIFDDCVVNMKYQSSIESFFYNSRHYGGSCFFLTQKCSAASQGWKANTMLYIVLDTASRKEKKYIAEDVLADAIEKQVPVNIRESILERIAYRLQTDYLGNFRALVVTPFCEDKLNQFKAPLMK